MKRDPSYETKPGAQGAPYARYQAESWCAWRTLRTASP